MSVVELVRAELAAGATTDAVARRLGMPETLVRAVVERLTAQGLARCGPTGCPPSREVAPPSCATCPLAPVD